MIEDQTILTRDGKTTVVIESDKEGKLRLITNSWENERVILSDQSVELRNVNGALVIIRRDRRLLRHARDLLDGLKRVIESYEDNGWDRSHLAFDAAKAIVAQVEG